MTLTTKSEEIVDSPRSTKGRWIENWNPDDEGQWNSGGKRIAIRNLVFSVFAEHIGFSVWLVWSALVVFLPKAGFAFTVDQLFWLVSVPALVGAFVRLPYTFAVGRFGGRNWTVISALLLLIPTIGLIACVSNPATQYSTFLLVAATAGLGGGNFASSTANISFFFPQRRKGLALGINAAGGNLGAASTQLLIPIIVVGAGGAIVLVDAGWIWLLPIAISAACAWFFMDNLRVSTGSWREQAAVARYGDTWLLALIYVGTFGSFMGYAMAFPLLLKSQFPAAGVGLAFLGALIGSLFRPMGGFLADRFGGARVTIICFVVMGFGVVSVLMALSSTGYWAFFASFMVLFAASGTANGSAYRMIPVLFEERAARAAVRDGASLVGARRRGQREAAAVVGLTSAVGALGGFLIPRGISSSLGNTGSIAFAMYVLLAFYLVCIVVTWRCYGRTAKTLIRV